MVVVLDFGSVLNKALIYDDGQFNFYKFSISYVPQAFNVKNVLQSFKKLEELSGKNLLGDGGKPKESFYLTSSLPLSSEIKGLSLIKSVHSTGEALSAWETPVLELGYRFVHFGGRVMVSHLRAEDITAWLPFKIPLSEIRNYLDNQKLYGRLLPIFPRDLYIEKAIAREKIIGLSLAIETQAAAAVVLSGSIFSLSPDPVQALQVFLDAFGKIGRPTEVFLDSQGLSPILGVLKLTEAQILSEMPEALKPISLCKVFRFREGVDLTLDLGLPESQKIRVDPESLFLFPLDEGEEAKMTFSNSARRGSRSEESFEVSGGCLGVVVDGRRLPLELPVDSGKRISLLELWEQQLAANSHLLSIPDLEGEGPAKSGI